MVQLLGSMPWDLRCARDYERMRSQFNWTQYKLLISISDPDKREYYELEAAKNLARSAVLLKTILYSSE